MAEIRVEPRKRGLGVLWTILALVVVALVVWYFLNNGRGDVTVQPTGTIAPHVPVHVSLQSSLATHILALVEQATTPVRALV
jgi:hypothetical protein